MFSVGVKKGDRVVIYMPMILELSVAMLACARIGAIHSIVVSICHYVLVNCRALNVVLNFNQQSSHTSFAYNLLNRNRVLHMGMSYQNIMKV